MPKPDSNKTPAGSSDPLLFGLGAGDPAPVPLPEPEPDDAELEAVKELFNTVTASDDAHADLYSSDDDVLLEDIDEDAPTPPPASSCPDVPPAPPEALASSNGVPILAANGHAFRDADAARFKKQRLEEETGEAFQVISLVDGGYALVPVATAAPPTFPSQPKYASGTPAAVNTKPSVPDLSDPDALSLDDFPEGHPVHQYGLHRFKKMLRKNFKIKQAYRSQIPLLFFAGIGGLVAAFPGRTLSLIFPPDSLVDIASAMSLERLAQAFSLLGLALCLFALGKIIYVRLYYRYLLARNYAKSERGIISKKTTKMVYPNILTTDLHVTVLGRVLNFGSIELSCAGTDGSEILIENVYSPELVQSVIEARILDAKTQLGR